MAVHAEPIAARPPAWRDPRVRSIVFQIVVALALILFAAFIVHNTTTNLAKRGIASGFEFLRNISGFPISQSLVHYELNDDFAQENGLICGGQMDVHIDPLVPAPRLYIIGAGHVGWHLARAAADAGFRIHIVDDREKFANAERFPAADEIVVEPIAEWLHRAELPASAYVVIVTRGHQNDLDSMRALAARDFRYVGLIGSRAKVARIRTMLLGEGMPVECLDRVHAPIGLDIGAVTPAEIAIAILAELIAVRRGVTTVRSLGVKS